MIADWLNTPAAQLNTNAQNAAETRQGMLTKPPGALGELESVAIKLAAMQGVEKPTMDKIHISVFAGDHGVAAQGVSAFPQAVTTEMVKNFASGGAAISVMAKSLGATLEVINLGTVNDPGSLPIVLDQRIAPSTADFTGEAAMTEEQFYQALNIGRQAAERAALNKSDLFIGGEMGIGNTTSATAIAAALLQQPAEEIVGPGTGVDGDGINRKLQVINAGLELHKNILNSPVQVLRCLGGFEIVALTGSYLACANMGRPVLVDGFISSVAALCASKINTSSNNWFLYSHNSAEPGHKHILNALNAKPLLNLGMRLGEGSGAAVAASLLKSACDLHNNMTTFAEAGVSEKAEAGVSEKAEAGVSEKE